MPRYFFPSILAVLLLAGCAATPLTEEEEYERDLKRHYEAENWALCEALYKHYGAPTVHLGHRFHDEARGKSASGLAWWIRSDLRTNNCQAVIGDTYWAH